MIQEAKSMVESSLPAHQQSVAQSALAQIDRHGSYKPSDYNGRETAKAMEAAGILGPVDGEPGAYALATGSRSVFL